MGRHSRRGPAPKDDAAETARRRGGHGAEPGTGPSPEAAAGSPRTPGLPGQRRAAEGGTPPRPADGAAPARPVGPDPRYGTGNMPRHPDGTPVRGVPRLPDGTPVHGVPRFPGGTPARGVPRVSGDGVPHGGPQVRGGHPEQWEGGGGWGEFGPSGGAPGAGPGLAPHAAGSAFPRQRQGRPAGPGGPGAPGSVAREPRQDYLDAFGEEDVDVFAPHAGTPGRTESERAREPYAPVLDPSAAGGGDGDADAPPSGVPAPRKGGGKGKAFTGIAAAAVTTVLAVVVAGQVADGHEGGAVRSQSATDQGRDTHDPASRGDGRATPSPVPLTYEQKMNKKYPLDVKLKGPGTFDTVPGTDKAPGKGQKYTYRVDIEHGLGLDGALFAEAVQKTLNDNRSWSHDGARTFERVSSGKADFVITLASPGTTATWCAKSGLDTAEENVSCDSAATRRVMINAYRWAQGSATYGDKIYAYRQMLINHEVGHRLGHNHELCRKNGELAPVMQQQTKFLDHDGIHCLANPWPYPKG
ncbi:DUF3152 domain-containing protein [Streptomyces sp. NPDC047028]|uniref:DUF3152 domain-containing protein n=1 Tax=Streptomyces sp. NPDC047028 TaxID=3155793 RepID=UPI0034071183